MNSAELFLFLERLNLPARQWVVFGGACLAAYDIRPTNDVDLFVKPSLYKKLKTKEWEERTTYITNTPHLFKVIDGIEVEAFIYGGSDAWVPNIAAYFKNPERINGFAFMPLTEMYAWKKATRRPKDVVDLGLIEGYWGK